eukprot:COSAG03_NODE_12238_length_556_cov_0.645514_1_plen_44_part_10
MRSPNGGRLSNVPRSDLEAAAVAECALSVQHGAGWSLPIGTSVE